MDKLSLLFVEAIRESGGQDAIVPGAFATVAMRNGILKNRARPKEEAPAKLGAAESHRVLSDLWGATEAQLDEEPELAEHLAPVAAELDELLQGKPHEERLERAWVLYQHAKSEISRIGFERREGTRTEDGMLVEPSELHNSPVAGEQPGDAEDYI